MTGECSVSLLQSALAGNLTADQEALLEQHLNACESCNSTMEHLAGGADWCHEAISILTSTEPLTDVPSEEFSEIDFTVEHLEPSDDPKALGQLGGYDVLEVVGRGGMGVVLKSYDRALKRCVAIKVLAPHLAQSSLAKKRFAREAQAAAAVVHPHVLAIHQVQPSGRLPFLVMPLVAGESLAQRLAAKGSLELTEVLRIGMQAAAGLAAAHEQGLVHRDVKPANILLEKGIERAVLTDFGLARAADDVALTRWGIIAGTPQYMSPEQAGGEPVDRRSDLFSLGCVLYEMATGVSPFKTDSTMATLRRLIDEEPQAMSSLNPELPPWFIGIVEKLLEKDPTKRFESAKEVSELLEHCLAHVQQPNTVSLPAGLPTVAAKPKPRWTTRRWIATIAVALFFAALGAGAIAVATAEPPDISGQWHDDQGVWGAIKIKKINSNEYTATYTLDPQQIHLPAATFNPESRLTLVYEKEGFDGVIVRGTPHDVEKVVEQLGATQPQGEIQLKWSRIERRFNGTWKEGNDRFGDISVRLVDNKIHGAYTTSRKAKINPATPKLADLTWSRPGPLAPADAEKAAQLSAEGWKLWGERNLDQATTKFEEAAKLDPTNANAWSGLGWSTWQSGYSRRAADAFNKAIKLEPKHPGALNGLGQLYLTERQYEKAEKFLIEAAPAAPAAWYGLARVYLLQDKFGDAEKWAQKIVDSGDTDAQQLLDAAKAKRLSPQLRKLIEPAGTLRPDETKVPGPGASLTAAEKQVIQAKLDQAQAELAIVEARYKAQAVSDYDYLIAKNNVAVLKAELTGDPALVAQAKLDAAKRKLEIISAAHQQQVISDLEFEKAKGEVSIAEAELRTLQKSHGKPANSKLSQPPSRSDAALFGQVIERTVNDDNKELGDFLLDLDTGKLFSPPQEKLSDIDELKWIRDHGVDALGDMRPGVARLIGFDMIAIPVGSDQWDCTPQLLLDFFAKEKLAKPDLKELKPTPVIMSTDPKNPLPTYFIQTREGAKGVLQVTGAIDKGGKPDRPRAIKIRYKLLQDHQAIPGLPAADQSHEKANFRGKKFPNLILDKGIDRLFAGADLRDSNLEGAKLVGGFKAFFETNFGNSNLTGAELAGEAAFQHANFEGVVLSGAVLQGGAAGFQECSFKGANLQEAALTGGASAFQRASFQQASLLGAVLKGQGSAFQLANFDSAYLFGAKIVCDSPTAFQSASINDTDFSNADISTIDAEALATCRFSPASRPKYNAATKLPAWFDPLRAGWRRVGTGFGPRNPTREPNSTENKTIPVTDPQRAITLGFGPTIERIVNDDDTASGDYLIDLDTGDLRTPPRAQDFANKQEHETWYITNSIDAMGETKSSVRGLLGLDMIAMPIDNALWDCRPEFVQNRLALGKQGTPATISGRGDLPTTFLIQTREGSQGVLQITSFIDPPDKTGDPRGVKIRYKLLRSDENASDKTPGIHIKLPLDAATHPQEMLRSNLGFDGLTILASGIPGTSEGKKVENVVIVMAHKCRLQSIEKGTYQGKDCWEATFFVPQGTTSDGSNLSLSQQRIDQLKEQGAIFQLEHYRGQEPRANGTTETTPAPEAKAEKASGRAAVRKSESPSDTSARNAVEAYMAAGLEGDSTKALPLAVPSKSAARQSTLDTFGVLGYAPHFGGGPLTMTVKQRSTTPVSIVENKRSLALDDITRGQVAARIVDEKGTIIAGPKSLRRGEGLPFRFEDTVYVARLQELSNALIGNDFAKFEISPRPNIAIQKVLISNTNERGIAASEKVRIAVANPDGREVGFLIFDLVKQNGKWLLDDVDFDTEAQAEEKLNRFIQQNHPDVVEVPAKPEVSNATTPTKLAPYSAIRWRQITSAGSKIPPSWSAQVVFDGQWHELLSINDLSLEKLVEFARQQYGDDWKQHFNEDLVELLGKMSKPPEATVKLALRNVQTGREETHNQTPMTAENHRSIWLARKSAEARANATKPIDTEQNKAASPPAAAKSPATTN